MTGNPRWPAQADPERAVGYAARFAALAANGVDVHGEATFCAALVDPGARVLDAGCGTGRVTIRLAQLGYVCLGVDNDEHMLAQARAASAAIHWTTVDGPAVGPADGPADGPAVGPADGPAVGTAAGNGPAAGDGSAARLVAPQWARADLATLTGAPELADSRIAGGFDLVVAAGNVVPLVAPGTEAAVIARLAAVLSPNGLFVSGFGLDAAHLPLREAPFGLAEYDRWCDAAGLRLERRLATWAGAPYDDGGYVVNVHRRS